MRYWLYVSKSTIVPGDAKAAVEELVSQARTRNAELSVTGALFYTGSHFAQFIEGPASSVLAVKSSILRDPRNCEIATLLDGKRETRRFSGWFLAYWGASLWWTAPSSAVCVQAARIASVPPQSCLN